MTHHPDKAREAARIAARFFVGAKAADVAIDAYLAASVPADEKIAELARNLACRSMALALDTTNDPAYLKDSAQRANADCSELGKIVLALSAKLKEQKAAHVKMLRDEAERLRAIGLPGPSHIRMLADKIEGDL